MSNNELPSFRRINTKRSIVRMVKPIVKTTKDYATNTMLFLINDFGMKYGNDMFTGQWLKSD